MAREQNIAVVGGGMTGLALSYFLREAGAKVTLFEGAPQLGGLSAAWDFGPFTWDRFYHVIAPADAAMIELVEGLGLGAELRWTPTRQGILMEGAVHPLRGPMDLLRLPRLGVVEKLRLGATAALARFSRPGDHLDRMTSAEWLARRCGQGGYDKLWSYLLRAKLGDAAEKVSARFIHATLHRLGKARGASGGGEKFGTVRGGYRRILDALVAHLETRGAACRPDTPIERIVTSQHGVHVGGPSVDEAFDHVCVTLPNVTLPGILPELDPALAASLAATPYLGVACTAVVGRKPLGPDYILNLCDPGFSITGVIEMSHVVDAEQDLNGHTLVYLPRYDVRGSAALAVDDDVAVATALGDLAKAHPHADAGWCVSASVHRAQLIQSLPMVGAPPVQAPRSLPGGRVHIVNNAQLPTCILNNNDCVGLARRAAADLLSTRS